MCKQWVYVMSKDVQEFMKGHDITVFYRLLLGSICNLVSIFLLQIFPLNERIENINDQYWTLRAEEVHFNN